MKKYKYDMLFCLFAFVVPLLFIFIPSCGSQKHDNEINHIECWSGDRVIYQESNNNSSAYFMRNGALHFTNKEGFDMAIRANCIIQKAVKAEEF
jgi:hypothetical protein